MDLFLIECQKAIQPYPVQFVVCILGCSSSSVYVIFEGLLLSSDFNSLLLNTSDWFIANLLDLFSSFAF